MPPSNTQPATSPVHPAPAAGDVATTMTLTAPSGTDVIATITTTPSEAPANRPVVFLHGLVGLNEHWDRVVDAVKHRFNCTRLELPLLQLQREDASVDAVTDLTIKYLDAVGGKPSVLVGNSFGGHVALRTALQRPDLVSALVLAGSSGLYERTFVKGAPVRPSREWLTEKIGELFYDKSLMRDADLDRAHRELNAPGGARAMVRLSKTARRNHLGERIADIHQPTLLIWGAEDVVTPPGAAREFDRLLPDSRLVWFPNCGHAPMIECPAPFADAMLEFANELDARTPTN